MASKKIKYSKEQFDNLLQSIFSGEINHAYNLPKDLYEATASVLLDAMYKGYGKKISAVELGSPDERLLKQLRENVYVFSGAKTYQQVRDISAKLVDAQTQQIVTFSEFKKRAKEVFDEYNTNWLRAEYTTAISMARNAEAWQAFESEAEVFPMLRYVAVHDANVCPICDPLDGISLPVGDPFWSSFMPPNHFNCRCIVEQYEEGRIEPSSPTAVDKATRATGDLMSEDFRINAGQQKIVFRESGDHRHPYFDVEERDRAFAQRNFDLPVPPPEE